MIIITHIFPWCQRSIIYYQYRPSFESVSEAQVRVGCSWNVARCMLRLHPDPAPTYINRYWCPLIFSNLRWWWFLFYQLVQTLYLHLWRLPSCRELALRGGIFPSSTGAYTECTYCNLHCVVVHGGGVCMGVVAVGGRGESDMRSITLHAKNLATSVPFLLHRIIMHINARLSTVHSFAIVLPNAKNNSSCIYLCTFWHALLTNSYE